MSKSVLSYLRLIVIILIASASSILLAQESDDVVYQAWKTQWEKQPETHDWFSNWRSTIQNSEFNLNKEQDLAQKHLLNLPGYVRKPSETELLELNKILKNNQLNDSEAWRDMGLYFNREFKEQRNPIWNPDVYTGPGPAHLVGIAYQGSSRKNGNRDVYTEKITELEKLLENQEKKINAQKDQIKLLTHSVVEILSKIEKMEAGQ